MFLDPNDNSRVVVILTAVGFTVPSEAVNFSVFDHELVFEFQFETTFDATPGPADPGPFFAETHVRRHPPDGHHHLAERPELRSADHVVQPQRTTRLTPTITTGPGGIHFFAGSADDPFFFDIPGFNRFVASVLAGAAGSGAT